MPAKYDPDERGEILPDPEDFEAVRNEPDDPRKNPDENDAHKYRLAQARKLIRLYELGLLPLDLMRELDALRVK